MYLAILCNSTVIEMYDDMFQISYGFTGCQMLRLILAIGKGVAEFRNGKINILDFLLKNDLRNCF